MIFNIYRQNDSRKPAVSYNSGNNTSVKEKFTVVPTKSDSDVILYLQLLRTRTLHLS